MPERRTALLAAGGTGGHIWPAVAVARALTEADPNWDCMFISGDRAVEAEVYRAAGVEPTVVRVPKPGDGRWKTWLAMAPLTLRAWKMIRRVKPRVILSTGGYVAAPVALAGWLTRTPTLLIEPNAMPGRVTRKLAPRVAAVALGDAAAAGHLRARRTEVTGTPQPWTRADLDRDRSRAKWGIAGDAVCILIAGGSQGARVLNGMMMETAKAWAARAPSRAVHLLWIAGSQNVEQVRGEIEAINSSSVGVTLLGHHAPFHEALAAADLAVSRAGAGSVADLALAGVPSVLLPLPIALDDHQRANAKRLVDAGAAAVFDERSQGAEELSALLSELIGDPDRLRVMSRAALSQSHPDAAKRVAEIMMELSGIL